MWLPFLGEKSGAITLALLGLTAGSQAVRQNSAKFKIIYWTKYSSFCYV